MSRIITQSSLIGLSEYECIDQQINKLAPLWGSNDDELPIFDILVDHGSKPGWFRSSIAVFLPDVTVHAHADSMSPSRAIKKAFIIVAEKALAYQEAKQMRHATVKDLVAAAQI